jgi:hypothetical protein
MPTTKKDLLDVRLNNPGLLIYQAACTGDPEKLEFVFNNVPENEGDVDTAIGLVHIGHIFFFCS